MKNLDLDLLKRAYDFSKAKHGDTLDDSGESYFHAHVEQVYLLVRQVTEDKYILMASLLHDTLEDTDTTIAELRHNFGNRVTELVIELTKDGYNIFPRLKSKEAILIKFADRLSNLSRMKVWDEKRQEKYLEKSKFWKEK